MSWWYRFRLKVSDFFYKIMTIAIIILVLAVITLPYVGVYILYIGIPTFLISWFLGWLFDPEKE